MPVTTWTAGVRALTTALYGRLVSSMVAPMCVW
jgi:hypothetical protein